MKYLNQQTTQQQPPMIDLNNLSEEHEIRFDYNEQGNLTRIRKVRRESGCSGYAFVIILVILGRVIWMYLNK